MERIYILLLAPCRSVKSDTKKTCRFGSNKARQQQQNCGGDKKTRTRANRTDAKYIFMHFTQVKRTVLFIYNQQTQ